MRISKEPEVRKQEIMDTAMKVFSEKGYEAATMKDIAREMNVAAGLCYHYFQNKQMLYEAAVKQYAKSCSRLFIGILKQTQLPLEECLEKLGQVWMTAEKNGSYSYENFFHGTGNELFHRQLEMEMIHEMLPCAADYLNVRKMQKEIAVSDTMAAARFILNGQIGIINDPALSLEKKIVLLKELVMKTLK